MTPSSRPEPIRTTDRNGQPIVRVSLNPEGTDWATVDAADFDSLPAEMSRTWLMNDSGNGYAYVKTPCHTASGRLIIPARIIAGARPRQQVTYRSGDRRDLRRSNLVLKANSRAKRDHLSEKPRLEAAE